MAASYLYYRHTLPVRVMHWINVIALTILLMSGLNIFSAHPALYWGKSSYTGRPPILAIESATDASDRVTGVTCGPACGVMPPTELPASYAVVSAVERLGKASRASTACL